MMEMKEVLK